MKITQSAYFPFAVITCVIALALALYAASDIHDAPVKRQPTVEELVAKVEKLTAETNLLVAETRALLNSN